jgi:hypothetical protein
MIFAGFLVQTGRRPRQEVHQSGGTSAGITDLVSATLPRTCLLVILRENPGHCSDQIESSSVCLVAHSIRNNSLRDGGEDILCKER